ncbi:hypothetical protein [Pseudomonas sp. AMR01]|uniref:hypothetical protein n=1 Tax=Pseudomonas sp. AMR01 TaxID=3064904 RepID=UPI0035C096C1
MAELAVAHYGGKALSGELSSAIKNGVNPNTGTKGQPVFGGGTDNEAGTLVERTVIEGPSKGPGPWVSAEGKVCGVTYQDVNQTTRPLNESDPKIPSLLTDRVAEKSAKILKKIIQMET